MVVFSFCCLFFNFSMMASYYCNIDVLRSYRLGFVESDYMGHGIISLEFSHFRAPGSEVYFPKCLCTLYLSAPIPISGTGYL